MNDNHYAVLEAVATGLAIVGIIAGVMINLFYWM